MRTRYCINSGRLGQKACHEDEEPERDGQPPLLRMRPSRPCHQQKHPRHSQRTSQT